jgi:plasmid stabilization system protein ParE
VNWLIVVRVELHPEARAEVRAAALWYEERRPGLGERFVERVNEALRRLEEAPARYPVWPGTEVSAIPIHKAVLDQFPYLVAFELHTDSVLVLAVAHAKRRPLYWLARTIRRPG